MYSSEDSNEANPTKEEIFYDFLIFRHNHREENLFLHGIFMDIMVQEYDIPCRRLKNMKDVKNIMLANPLSPFIDVLRLC